MLKIFNTLTNSVEEFHPIQENKVTMYVCGPTVYDYPHLGHARCYITWDILYRYLKFLGYDVKYCRNVTDVDDKILAKAKKEHVTPDVITKKYYDIFADNMLKLNTLKPDFEPRATKTLGEMIKMVKVLVDKGFAYEADGDVYFSVEKFGDYGKLSKQPLKDLEAGIRVETTDKKKNPLDFALWKKDEENGYQSPWGVGRPGWHIECSAMSRKYLGEELDIHAGGADLIFPHHENELAQSTCANGKQFVRYWLHNGFVTINKEKMSKSLQNFVTIPDLLKLYDANTIRFFILTNHYRMPVEFNDEALNSAKTGYKRIQNAINEAAAIVRKEDIKQLIDNDSVKSFKEAMDNDLNTSVAMSVLFDLATKINKSKSDYNALTEYYSTLLYLANALGFDTNCSELSNEKILEMIMPVKEELDFVNFDLNAEEIVSSILNVRAKARADKEFAIADKIRNSLDKVGLTFKDGKDASKIVLKN